MGEIVTPPIICPTLVGRIGQFATLQRLIEQAKQGEGHVVLISGEAGIGKSRLVAEAKNHAEGQGFLLLQGNCFPTDLTYPYAPLLDLLRALVASSPTPTGGTADDGQHRLYTQKAVEDLARDLFP